MAKNPPSRHLSTHRRGFLRALGIGAAAPAIVGASALRADSARGGQGGSGQGGKGTAKNVLFFVSDGMNVGTLSLTDLYSREFLDRRDPWVQLYLDRPDTTVGLMDMASADSPVTDSAAAASSWSSGQRIPNGALNVDAEGKRLEPLYEALGRFGKATGLVTTARITHATPAGFAASADSRGEEDAIAPQYRELGVEVLLGGGSVHFDPAKREDGIDLAAAYANDGYEFVRDRAGLLRSSESGTGGKLLGLFTESHLPYEIDRLHDKALKEAVPSLAEMTEAALRRFADRDEGFVLQIEGARVDHAGHANDLGAILGDQAAFGDALAVGLKWAEGRDDTLIVICTDHGCGGPNLNGVGSGYRESGTRFSKIGAAKSSVGALVPTLVEIGSSRPGDLAEVAGEALGFEMTSEAGADLASLLRELESAGRDLTPERLSPVLSPYQSGPCGVTWNSSQHTGDFVEIAALGPASASLPRFVSNTDIRPWLLEAMGLA